MRDTKLVGIMLIMQINVFQIILFSKITIGDSYTQREYFIRQKSRPDLYYLSAPCGSGKTKAICDKICSDWIFGKNILLVLPTIALIDDVSARLSEMGITFQAFHSRCSHQETTVKAIQDQLTGAIDLGEESEIEQILLNVSNEPHIQQNVRWVMRSLRIYGKI